MFKILFAYEILSEIVDAIRVMYENTSALVVTPEGNTEIFQVDTGILEEDPLAPFFFPHLLKLYSQHLNFSSRWIDS